MPTKEQIEQIIKELQKTLHLQDWEFQLYFISEYEMKDIMKVDHLDTIGCVHRYQNQKLAYIKLNVDHSRINESWYATVVHEMLHIHGLVLHDILLNATDDTFIRNYYDQESETYNCTLEKIIVGLYPVSNFDYILNPQNQTISDSIKPMSGMTPIMRGE
jgi:hypothetical protein